MLSASKSGGGAVSGYNLTRSLRFRASASAYLNRTPASATNRQTFTHSFWAKLGALTTNNYVFSSGPNTASDRSELLFTSVNTLQFGFNISGTWYENITTQVFRDPSSWYHIVWTVDTTQVTAANRSILYVNGIQITSFSSTSYPPQNSSTSINNNVIQGIGYYSAGALGYFDGYLAEVNFIDGQALTPSSFGSTNTLTGVWQPARYTGSYGTNGFYLPFTDNSALTTSSNVGIGKDFSGNGNYWTTNNISITAGVTYDSMTDVCTLTSATASNFAVANPLSVGANTALTDGNLTGTFTGSGGFSGTICGLTSGKWYYETTNTAGSGNSRWVGFLSDVYTKNDNAWSYSTQTALYANDARNGNNASYGATWTVSDVIGVALDLSTSSGSITFYKNGVSQGVMFSSLTSSAVWRPLVSSGGTGTTMAMNFGQRPFTYTPPTGFVALNTFNLLDSTIVKGNKVMDATLYTGTLLSNAVTNAAAFKPDLVWVKSRSAATDHKWTDSVRGVTKGLISNTTGAETTDTQGLTAFNTNGFAVGTNTDYNNLSATYVGWQWQAGQGTTSSNTSGSITSTVSVNASAGFSVVTYTATAATGTIGHGLGVAPSWIITARRSSGGAYWGVYHKSLGASQILYMQTTDGVTADSTTWNATSPTSSVFSVGNSAQSNNPSSATYVAYCWTPIAGYSAFGSVAANGAADNAFVYTGFLPRFVLFKRTDSTSNWYIWDTARNTFNVLGNELYPNLSNAEASAVDLDILSNGFKLRSASFSGTWIYAAFATAPFKNSLGF